MKGGFLGRHQPKNIPDSAHTFSQPLSLKSCSSSENGGMETGIHLNLRSSIGGETSLTSSGRSSPSASTPSRIFSSLSAVISIYMNHPSLDFFSNYLNYIIMSTKTREPNSRVFYFVFIQ